MNLNTVKTFRHEVYQSLKQAKDALFNLLDALAAQYRRIASRRGSTRAAMAVAHSILVIIYRLLKDRTSYLERGETFLEEHDRQIIEKRLIRQLERFGNQVTVEPLVQAG